MADLGRLYIVAEMDLDSDDEACESTFGNVVEFPNGKANTSAPHSNLDSALRLAKAGISIFPCRNAPGDGSDKSPLGVQSWTKESKTDENKIREWFRKYPDALIGIDCGKSGLVVIDCDRHGGPDGVAAFDDLTDANGGIPYGPMTLTQGNGQHHFFHQPDGDPIGCSAGALPDGIDVKAAGGYVIAQGSMRLDGVEGWKPAGSPCPGLAEAFAAGTIPVIPQWLADIIRAPKRRDEQPQDTPAGERKALAPARHSSAPSSPTSDARGRAVADKALADHVTRLSTMGEGSRNRELNNAALDMGHIIARGWIGEQEVRAALEGAMHANGYVKSDGIGAVRKTLNSGIGKGKTEPHKDLDDREGEDDAELLTIGNMLIEGNRSKREAEGRKLAKTPDGTSYDAETGEIVEEKQPAQKPITLNIINAASLAGLPVPERRWLVQDMIPESKVTLLYGDGGSGKSLLAVQLAVAVATGGEWLGMDVERGRVLYLSCEDEIDEHHRRLDAINNDLRRLSDLDIIDLAGEDAVLSAPMGRGGMMRATALFHALRAEIVKRRPSLLVLDNLADVFGGDEINKLNVRQFCTMLNKLARELQVTILMLAHPSVSGMSSGSGTSGNVAWSNSVRSRLYLERKITREGQNTAEDNPDIRILTTKKSNGAASGTQITMRWEDWKFIREENVATNAAEITQESEYIFMKLLKQFEREGRAVSYKPSSLYAPKVFAEHPGSGGIAKRFFEKAMNNLFNAGKIKVGTTEGPPSKQREIIVEAVEDYSGLVRFGDEADD